MHHKRQLTIVLFSCVISLFLAFLLIDGFHWSVVIDEYIEWEVMIVVFGMSLLVEATSETGIFDWLIIRILKVSQGKPFPLFVLTFMITLALSTMLANVTAMILVSSMILIVCKGLDYDPVPFLFAAVLATDLAGMTTVVSSLPAIMVGTAGGIGFIDFIVISTPFLFFAVPICLFYLKKVFPPEKIPLSNGTVDTQMILDLDEWGVIENRKSFYLAWIALGGTIVGLALSDLIGIPIEVIAVSGGIIAIVLTKADETRLIRALNWDTLLFFAGLFVLVGTLEETGVLEDLALIIRNLSGEDLFISGFLILAITAIFSGILDNIPVTAALIPVVDEISQTQSNNPNFLWFVLVFSGTLGGGWTPFGSAASILVISILAKEKRPLDFKHFIKVFLPISLFLLVLSGIYLTVLAIFNFI